MRSYPVKENHIGSVDNEILRYRHTDRQPDNYTSCYFIIRSYADAHLASRDLIDLVVNEQKKITLLL